MELVAIVTGLALLQVIWFSIQVGQQRAKHGINAPAMSGHQDFDRMFRIHQNTIEQLVIFIPAMWLFGYYMHAQIAAGLGVVFIIGRQLYRNGYLGDPKGRAVGFGLGGLATLMLLLGGMVGAGMSYF